MNSEHSILNMGINFSHRDRSGGGFLLSMDEVELVRNMSHSLQDRDEQEFLLAIAEKEYITMSEKEKMEAIFIKEANKIKEEATLSL